MDKNILKTMCRLCLKQNKTNMVPLFDENDNNLTCYGQAVEIITNIVLSRKQNLPTLMCQKCLLQLQTAILFKKTCEQSQKNITSLINKVGDCTENDTNDNSFDFDDSFETTNKYDDVLFETMESFVKRNELKSFDYKSEIHDPNTSIPENGTENQILFNTIEKLFVTNEDSTEGFTLENVSKKRRKIKKIKTKKCLKKQTNITCEVCQKVFASRSTYSCHKQRHSGTKVICEHCGKSFLTKPELQVHLVLIHNTGKYFPCDKCDYKAPRRFDLKEHERLHTGERPFTCDQCGLTFRRRYIWKRHLVNHTEKEIQCSLCPRRFHFRGELTAHSNNVHKRRYAYACAHCSVTYASCKSVRKHLQERHGVSRESQGRITRINMVAPEDVAMDV